MSDPLAHLTHGVQSDHCDRMLQATFAATCDTNTQKSIFSPTLEPNSKTAILVATSEFSIALNSHLSAPVQVPAKLGRNCPISQPGEKTDERKTHLLERETDNLNRPLDHVDGT